MQPLWSRKLAAPPRGLSLAREGGRLLVWDADSNLHLFNRSGEPQAHANLPAPVIDACCSDDGRAFAAVGAGGQVWMLAPDLTPRWERAVPQRGTAVALDPFGRCLAAADGDGGLSLFGHDGRPCWRVANPRPLRHVAFIPERPALAASADIGQVCCFDSWGNRLWRDAPMAHIGALAPSGDGATIALACFSDGLNCYSLDGPKRRCLAGVGACRLAAVSYDGDAFLTADLDRDLTLWDAGGSVREKHRFDNPPSALALDAGGEEAVVALADGRLVSLRAG